MFTLMELVQPASIDEAYEILMKRKNNQIIGGSAFLRMGKKRIGTGIDLSNLNLNTRSDYVFLFSTFFTYKNNGDEEYLKMLFETLNGISAGSIVGSGSDYSKTNVKKYLEYISNLA